MENYKYTKEDHAILESYKNFVNSISNYLGENSEVVLHSFEDISHSVISIANEHITNRKIGSPITDIGIKMMAEIAHDESKESFKSYFTESVIGKCTKSNSTVIKNSKGKVIGMLCINWYFDSSLLLTLKAFIPNENNAPKISERFGTKAEEIIQEAIENAITGVDKEEIGASAYNKTIIRKLHAQGIFEFKEAVQTVANHLNISHHTVYLHLRSIKKRNKK